MKKNVHRDHTFWSCGRDQQLISPVQYRQTAFSILKTAALKLDLSDTQRECSHEKNQNLISQNRFRVLKERAHPDEQLETTRRP